MKTKIRLAILELLADDHWIVRQEVLDIDALTFVLLFFVANFSLHSRIASFSGVQKHFSVTNTQNLVGRPTFICFARSRSANKLSLLSYASMVCSDHFLQAVNAMKRFANFRDIDVISKAVSILPHPEAKVRQVKHPVSARIRSKHITSVQSLARTHLHTQVHAHRITHSLRHSLHNLLCCACAHVQVAVTVLNSFIDTDGQHDGMSNKQVAQKMMESGLIEQVRPHVGCSNVCECCCCNRKQEKDASLLCDLGVRTVLTQASFEALDDNGNGRLSAKELRAGLKEMINIVFSVPRFLSFRPVFLCVVSA
jgi:hypothetical protein